MLSMVPVMALPDRPLCGGHAGHSEIDSEYSRHIYLFQLTDRIAVNEILISTADDTRGRQQDSLVRPCVE